jgi:hypothetical protein
MKKRGTGSLWLARLFLFVVLAGSVAASARNLAATKQLGSIADDPVADWEQRFVAVKARLPFTRGFVGYISDSDVPGAAFDPANDEGEYVLTQYAMAPDILVRGTAEEWNIANLSREAFQEWAPQHRGSFDITPLQSGLYLLHRIAE